MLQKQHGFETQGRKFKCWFYWIISYTYQLEISAKALPHLNDFLACVSKGSRTKSFSKIQLVTTESITNKGSQNQPGNLWSLSCGHDVLHFSYSSIVGATFEHLKICPNTVQDKSLIISSAWKRKIEIEDWAKLHISVHDNFRLPRYF